jgi:transcriptional regulator with XRE-family HTH domain
MITGQLFDSKKNNRQATLQAWLAYHGIAKKDLARELDVHPSMITRIIKGERAPRQRLEQLKALGIPEELLPAPSRPVGRPPLRSPKGSSGSDH